MDISFFMWTLGAALAFAAGNILQKVGLVATMKRWSSSGARVRGVLHNLWWWGGMVLSAIATLLYYGSLARWNLSLVQPMLSLNPVLTALAGWWLLKEKMDKRSALAILCCSVALAMAGTLAGEMGGKQNILRLGWFLTMVILAGALLPLLVKRKEVVWSAWTGLGFGISAILWKSLSLLEQPLMERIWQWQTLAFVLAYVGAFVFSQLALAQGRALFVIPFSAALGAALPIVAGGFVFGDPFPIVKWIAAFLVLMGSLLFVRVKPPLDY